MPQLTKEILIYDLLQLGRKEEANYLSEGNNRKASHILLARNHLVCALLGSIKSMRETLDLLITNPKTAKPNVADEDVRKLLINFKEMLSELYGI